MPPSHPHPCRSLFVLFHANARPTLRALSGDMLPTAALTFMCTCTAQLPQPVDLTVGTTVLGRFEVVSKPAFSPSR